MKKTETNSTKIELSGKMLSNIIGGYKFESNDPVLLYCPKCGGNHLKFEVISANPPRFSYLCETCGCRGEINREEGNE